MTWQAWFTLAVVAATVVMLARDTVAPAVAVLGADVVLMVAGVIDADAAFSGFANPAPLIVAALFVVAAAVEKTGALQPLVAATLGKGGSPRGDLARLAIPTASVSAFLNNTPIVAMLAPQVADWAERRGKPVSLYLIPVSFATLLGGVVTLIGTSTNLVVSGLMETAGMAPLGMFELTRAGLPVAVAGVACIVLLAPRLLPDRRSARRALRDDLREFVIQLEVAPGGPLDGATVEGGGLRHLQGVFLAQLEREGESVAAPPPSTPLRGGDRLTFAGRVDMVRDLRGMRGLVLAGERHVRPFDTAAHTFFEAVVSGASGLVGKTLKEAEFRGRYLAAVLAIHRAGQRVNAKLGTVPLREGDTLLLLSDRGFGERWRHGGDFLLVAPLGGSPAVTTRQAWFVGLVTFAIVGVAGAGLLPLLHASLVGALALVVGGVLRTDEARQAVDLDVVVLIAASFGIGAALEVSGLAAMLASGVVGAFQGMGPRGVLLAVTVATTLLTQVITNNAAAVLAFPIAMATAGQLGLNPRAFAVAVAIAASASFMTPIGYQTNAMVYGIGGYRFGDFMRLGLPLSVLVILVVTVIVPLFWPL
ncbi:MAG TPA: SLC13 family permease [Longimicrobium sp.]|nr:SLC13 family permease [Longimicrobium sp.]